MVNQTGGYRTCFVPLCKNTTIKTPHKIFFVVPKDLKMRQKWFDIVRRSDLPTLSRYYCCEDHFDVRQKILVVHCIKFLKLVIILIFNF